MKRAKSGRTILPLLGALLIGLCVTAFFLWRQSRLPTTRVLRNDTVQGRNGKRYRRIVRIDRDPVKKITTTAVTFTDVATGKTGSATLTQPDKRLLPTELLAFGATLKTFTDSMALGLTPGTASPLIQLSIPQPIPAGYDWKALVIPVANGELIQYSGKSPPAAEVISVSPFPPRSRTETRYGLGVQW